MANILYANNAAGTLAAPITNASTTLTLNVGQAALFPNPSAPQVFYATLTDVATQTLIEIVQVTAVAGNNFSIVRAQDGTTALSWNAGDIVSLRTIRLELQGFENAAEGLFGAQGVPITPSTTLGIVGTTLGDNANPGSVGEFITTTFSAGFPNNTQTNVVAMSLPAGDWDVTGAAAYIGSAGTTINGMIAGISTVSATLSGTSFDNAFFNYAASAPSVNETLVVPVQRVNLAAASTVFLVGLVNFTGGGVTASGRIRARRMR